MPATRARVAPASEAVAFPQLPHELVTRHIFALVPVDTLLRCAEVSRGWRATSSQRALWRRVDLSRTSGVALPVSPGLLRATLAKASGVLEELDLTGARLPTFVRTLSEALAGNTDAAGVVLHIGELCPADVSALFHRVTPLREVHTAYVCLVGDVSLRLPVLRNYGMWAPLRLQSLTMWDQELPNREDDTPLLLQELGDLTVHPSLKRLRLTQLDLRRTPGQLKAFLDVVILRRLSALDLDCRLPVGFAHDLARVMRDGALAELYIGDEHGRRADETICQLEGVLDVDGAATLASALRGNRTLTALGLRRGVGLLSAPPAATAALLDAITRHPTLRSLNLSYDSAEQNQAAAGAAIAALIAAPSRLTSLNLSNCCLGEVGMTPICDALRPNTRLRQLTLGGTNLLSKRFARELLIPAADAAKCALRPIGSFKHLRDDPNGGVLPPAERRAVYEQPVKWIPVVLEAPPTPPQGGRFAQWFFGLMAMLQAVGRARRT
jgi:hypothetical protein